MELGAFSVSLSVKDIQASKTFYEKLGFTVFGGDLSQNWLISVCPKTSFSDGFRQNFHVYQFQAYLITQLNFKDNKK